MSQTLYNLLHVHVLAPDREVLRELRRRYKPEYRTARSHRTARRKMYRQILACHHRAAAIFRKYRF